MRFRIKGLDDALSDQGKTLSGITNKLNQWMRVLEREFKNIEESPEFNVTAEGPFKNKRFRSIAKAKEFYDKIPRYMYLDSELTQIDEQIKELYDKIKKREKTKLIKILEGLIVDETDDIASLITPLESTVENISKAAEESKWFDAFKNLKNIKTFNEFKIKVENSIQELKN